MKTTSELKHVLNTGWKLPFFTIWTGQAFSLLGSALVGFALIWWMTETTGSATVLATAAMFEFLPRVLAGPLAGTLVDRWNRRHVMLVADTVTALATAVFVMGTEIGIDRINQLKQIECILVKEDGSIELSNNIKLNN